MDVFKKRQSKIRWHWQPLLFHPHLILRRSRFKRQLRRIAHAAFTPLQGFEEFLQVLRSRHGNRTESPPANGFTRGGKWYACMVIARVVELVYPLSPVFFCRFLDQAKFLCIFRILNLEFLPPEPFHRRPPPELHPDGTAARDVPASMKPAHDVPGINKPPATRGG